MLKRVRIINFDTQYAYAPPVEPGVINIDEVSSAKPTEVRGGRPCVLVKMRNGETITIVGTPEDLLEPVQHE
jgi:putative hemolysin